MRDCPFASGSQVSRRCATIPFSEYCNHNPSHPGLGRQGWPDGHDRGAKIIARALRDAGMEVLYTGLRKTPESIVQAAIQEDVDCIGLSILSGAHNALVPRMMALLKAERAEDILVVLGGTIPQADVPGLKAQGVAEVFGPGTPLEAIVQFLRQNVRPRTAILPG